MSHWSTDRLGGRGADEPVAVAAVRAGQGLDDERALLLKGAEQPAHMAFAHAQPRRERGDAWPAAPLVIGEVGERVQQQQLARGAHGRRVPEGAGQCVTHLGRHPQERRRGSWEALPQLRFWVKIQYNERRFIEEILLRIAAPSVEIMGGGFSWAWS